MKIALVGYGGMGRAVGRIAKERGHEVMVVDPHAEEAVCASLTEAELDSVDVVVDFSLGEFALDHLELCVERGVNLVIGSTGWYDSLEEVRKKVEASEIGMMWSSNFSIGVNLYFKMVEAAAKMIDKFDEYDVWGHEIHHFNKADSPSGTAKSLEKILLENISRKDSVVEEKLDRRREDNEIHFSSVRGGAVNFEHTIAFDSAADRISLKHEARCRDGYALGAVKAAEWLKGKRGYHEMNDFLNL